MNGLIYTGGDWPDLATAKMLSERADVSICCDGAAEEAYRYGLPFQTLVGDMDSIRPDLLEAYQSSHEGLEIIRRATRFFYAAHRFSIQIQPQVICFRIAAAVP